MSAWDQPAADPRADIIAAVERSRKASYEPSLPLLSPRCGLDGHIDHAACRSLICECECHYGRALSAGAGAT